MTDTTAFPYTVVGGGAIGGMLAAALLDNGVPVQIVDADPAHVAAIRAGGLRVVSAEGTRTAWVPAFGLDDAPAVFGPVLLAVKGQATGSAMAFIAPRLAADGFVVSMQNGLNEDEIASVVGAERTVAAFVDLFADVMEPGVVKDGGPGAMSLGEHAGRFDSARVLKLRDDLRLAGHAVVTPNVLGYLWSKLAFGTMSSVTALVDADMYDAVDRHRPTMHGLAAEVIEVADALGIPLEDFDAFIVAAYRRGTDPAVTDATTDGVVAWLASQPKLRSGVWRDVAVRRRKTEVVAHFAPVIAHAADLGIEVPLLHELLRLIAAIENGEIVHDDAHLSALDALVTGS
ncbi:2-dehydropantoate 2-reductase [Conyzicola lurida]|uniref:2-dehydropantoate 2-reductase n=1 Tax=Conyzicola lurida TaxID=1172621 RepID=A0A841AKA5_9MICO|nr:2-dehydropantoate 2-reductase N-terminal domain-containing protein [Conyzicola lurida]MBB5842156.1 2-dehydropantoate 2-reductase [Conyzicola lurida]